MAIELNMQELLKKVKVIPLDEVKEYKRNTKLHPEKQIDLLVKQYKKVGYAVPIVLDKDNIIIAGHARFAALKKMGIKEVMVLRMDNLTPLQINALRIADNKIGELGTWNMEDLEKELQELQKDKTFDLELTGFNELELYNLSMKDEDFEADESEEPEEKVKVYRASMEFDTEDARRIAIEKLTKEGYKIQKSKR